MNDTYLILVSGVTAFSFKGWCKICLKMRLMVRRIFSIEKLLAIIAENVVASRIKICFGYF